MKIGFFDYCLNYRGTTRAIHQYCKILLSDSNTQDCTFFFEAENKFNALKAARLFTDIGVSIQPIASREELMHTNLDFLYHVTSGDQLQNDWIEHISCSNVLIHQVGYQPPHQTKHKLVYTSYWQSYYLSSFRTDVLPYIVEVDVNEHMSQAECRRELGIPEDAIVLGRHGGYDTWNLGFVNDVVKHVVMNTGQNIYFLFMNTPMFIVNEKRAIFLPGSHEINKLNRFFCACDAMLHARWEGETFGMACAEFLFRKKPIISWIESRERNHILMADRSLIGYNGPSDLYLILTNLTRSFLEHKSRLIDISVLQALYSPEAVKPKLRQLITSYTNKDITSRRVWTTQEIAKGRDPETHAPVLN